MAYRLMLAWSLTVRPSVRGVKCVLRDPAGRLLFVCHHYGDRSAWELPGGAVHRGEAPEDAVAREALEELGVRGTAWRHVATEIGHWHGKDERLAIFEAPFAGGAIRPDPVEIAHLGWFRLDDAPERLGPTTEVALRRLRSRG